MNMKRFLASLLLLLSFPCFSYAENGNEQGGLGGSGQPILIYRNENATPIATAETYNGKLSGNRYGDAFMVLRSSAQTPIPMSAQPSAILTPSALVSVQATAIPTAYSTPQVAAVTGLRYLQINNASDAKLLCSYGGNTDHFDVLAGTVLYMPFAANGVLLNSNVNCHNADDGTNTGTVTFSGYK